MSLEEAYDSVQLPPKKEQKPETTEKETDNGQNDNDKK